MFRRHAYFTGSSLLPFLMPDEGSGSGGGNGSEQDPENNGDPSGNTGEDSGETPPTQQPPASSEQIVFPDRASFMRRVEQASRKAIEDQFKDLGLSTLEDVKAAAQKAVELEKQNQTEADRQKDRAEKLQRELEQVRAQSQEDRLMARVTHLSTTDDEKVRQKFDKVVDPETAFRLIDRSGIEYMEDGTVSGVEEALAKLVADKPFLKVSHDEPSHTVPASPKGNRKDTGETPFALRYITGRYKGPAS